MTASVLELTNYAHLILKNYSSILPSIGFLSLVLMKLTYNLFELLERKGVFS